MDSLVKRLLAEGIHVPALIEALDEAVDCYNSEMKGEFIEGRFDTGLDEPNAEEQERLKSIMENIDLKQLDREADEQLRKMQEACYLLSTALKMELNKPA